MCFLCAGLVHEDSLVKMRLGSLTGLASKGSGEIPYTVVRDTLKVYYSPRVTMPLQSVKN